MTQKISYLFCLLLLAGCNEELLTTDELITLETSSNEIPADGESILTLSAYPNKNAVPEKRTVLFYTDGGVFVENNETEISKKAEKVDGVLQVSVKLKAPTLVKDFEVRAEMDIADLRGLYVARKLIGVDSSIVCKIKLETNGFSVDNNFEGEIKITGTLYNQEKKGVTQGIKVIFEDVMDDLVTPVNGAFRETSLISNANSQVSALYSPGLITEGQFVYIIGTVLKLDQQTSIRDTLKLYIK